MTTASKTTLTADSSLRYAVDDLAEFATVLLENAGVDREKARPMTARMLDGDLLGHRTHGLWFLSAYLERLRGEHIKGTGELGIVLDEPTAVAWQGNRLPGAWVMEKATALILQRIRDHAIVTVTIADCSHIGCLQSYLLPFTEQGLLVVLNATNPGVASVAAPGGSRPVITSNPMAMGIPSHGQPILIDQSTSVASNALFQSFASRGERLPGQWVIDADGVPSDDPRVLSGDPPGTIQPLGQSDFGYKGFGFGLMCEALSLALPGYGRRRQPDRFGQGVFLQVIDPARFSEESAFLDEMDYLIESVRSDSGAGGSVPRLPGQRALALRSEQLEHGIVLPQEVLDRIAPWAEEAGIKMPVPLSTVPAG